MNLLLSVSHWDIQKHNAAAVKELPPLYRIVDESQKYQICHTDEFNTV